MINKASIIRIFLRNIGISTDVDIQSNLETISKQCILLGKWKGAHTNYYETYYMNNSTLYLRQWKSNQLYEIITK